MEDWGGDFSDFERDIVLVPHRLVYWDFPPQFRELSEKEKLSSEQHFSGKRCLVNATGQRKKTNLLRGDGNKLTKMNHRELENRCLVCVLIFAPAFR